MPYDDLEGFAHGGLVALLDYWNVKRRERIAPSRADIDPAEIPALLANLFLVDVEGDPPVFRIRLVGTAIVDRYGEEIRGRTLEELDLGDQLDSILDQYHQTVRHREPTYCRHRFWRDSGGFINYERLLLPLSSDGERIDVLMGGIYELPDPL